jgi:hypothetical protein
VNGPLYARLGFLIGLIIAATSAAWWLAGTRGSLVHGGGGSGIAQSALVGLWLARAVVLSPFALRAGVEESARSALAASLALVMTAWPLLLITWQASMIPGSRLLLSEILLLGGGALLACVGAALRTLFRSTRNAVTIATMLGIAISAATWTWGVSWMSTLT